MRNLRLVTPLNMLMIQFLQLLVFSTLYEFGKFFFFALFGSDEL